MESLTRGKRTVNNNGIAPFYPSKAINGLITPIDRWLCNPVPCSLAVDLGAPCRFDRWVVYHMGSAGWESPEYNMSDYILKGSNDCITWTDIDSVMGNTFSMTDRTIRLCEYRYVGVFVTRGLNKNQMTASIVQFDLYCSVSSQFLSNLVISNGTLTPAFNKNTYSYTAEVSYSTGSISVTPTGEDQYALITVNGQNVPSGQQSQPINLAVGINTITVRVTAGIGGAIQEYKINVNRRNEHSGLLSDLVVSGTSLSPAFNSSIFDYSASVSYDVASVTVKPTTYYLTDTITVNGVIVPSGSSYGPINLKSGSNTITITVKAAGSNFTNSYRVVVNKAENNYLEKVEVKYTGFGIQPSIVMVHMNHVDLSYLTYVPAKATSATISPFAEDGNAYITVNGQPVASGGTSAGIALSSDTTNVNIVVGTGSTARSYTISIART